MKSCRQNRNGIIPNRSPSISLSTLASPSVTRKYFLVLTQVSNPWKKCETVPSPGEVCTKSRPCQDIPLTISALSSGEDMKGALCAASRSMANWLLFPLIKCAVYLIFHSISKPLKPRGLSSCFWRCFFTSGGTGAPITLSPSLSLSPSSSSPLPSLSPFLLFSLSFPFSTFLSVQGLLCALSRFLKVQPLHLSSGQLNPQLWINKVLLSD